MTENDKISKASESMNDKVLLIHPNRFVKQQNHDMIKIS